MCIGLKTSVSLMLSFLLPALAAGSSLPRLTPDCPDCNYSFPGVVPPPMVGGVATGSGFVVHPDGYVLTNYHVVSGSSTVKVLVGGTEYTAAIVESLPAQDLALLKIDAHGLTAVTLGDSDLLQIGDDVFAIGCPGGICGTVTAGRLANAGVAISIEGGGELQDMLMVDITTDHGSSGGPLANSRGEVVGITTAGSQGSFGFSIPIRHAIPLLRRVPSFDVKQMGTAAAELPFREIRDRMTPVTTFIKTDQGTPLGLPSRYTVSPLWRGVVCSDLFAGLGGFCPLDSEIPPGFRLLGYSTGVADYQTWTRSFAAHTEKPITFTQEVHAWIMQFDTPSAAQAVARAYNACAPEQLVGGCVRCSFDSAETHVYCDKDSGTYYSWCRDLIFSGTESVGPLTVSRQITKKHCCRSSSDGAELAYSTVASLAAC
jgi:hypothetical protein